MGEKHVFFLLFRFLGYQKMEKMKDKPKKEIFLVFVTMGLVVLRTFLSLVGLNSGNANAMQFSLYLNLIPVLQTVLVLLRKVSELDRKRGKSFNGVYRTANILKEPNPFLRRLFMLGLFLSTTVIAPTLFLFRYSSDNSVATFLLEFVVWTYMIMSTVDGIMEQLIVLYSVDV